MEWIGGICLVELAVIVGLLLLVVHLRKRLQDQTKPQVPLPYEDYDDDM